MSAITFRSYQPHDHDTVWSVFAACTHQLGFGLGSWDDDMHNIPDSYQASGEFIVGESDGQVVAFAGLRCDSPDRAEIRRVGVHPDMQQRGFGRALIHALEQRASNLGIRYLYLDTSVSQIAAQRLYRACGYREVERVEKSGIECIVFTKALNGS